MDSILTYGLIVIVILAAVLIPLFVAFIFRRVVPTNAVHIVQSSKHTLAYGKEMEVEAGATALETHGNTYYEWPSFLPVIGVRTTELPLSVFDLYLENYAAYDSGRLPFVLDVMAFFRISNPTLAAQRVSHFAELKEQMLSILQGAIRTILASVDIEQIMSDRAVFGEKFTKEVDAQLTAWGVTTVKSIELMDIRDAQSSKVIFNIMSKKQSHIEMESRVELAKNKQAADIAEIDAQRQTDLQRETAKEVVGKRQAEVKQAVGIATEKATQEVQAEAKTTAEKQMAVNRVTAVTTAEIQRDTAKVVAEQDKAVRTTNAEADKAVQVTAAEAEKGAATLQAEAQLILATNEATAVKLRGEAAASAERLMLMAPVDAQVELAEKMGAATGFQDYQVRLKQVDADKEVGIARANALVNTDTKIIVTSNSVDEGLGQLGKIFSPAGGNKLAATIEGFLLSDVGKTMLEKFIPGISKD